MFPKGDPIGIIERSYDLASDTQPWIQALTESMQGCLGLEAGMSGICFDRRFSASMDRSAVTEATCRMCPVILESCWAVRALFPPSVRALFAKTRCATFTDMVEGPLRRDRQARDFHRRYVRPSEPLVICCTNPDQSGVLFTSILPEPARLPKAVAEHWMRVASHVAAGLRLRLWLAAMTPTERDALSDGEAILDPSGKLQHAEESAKAAPVRAALRNSVVAVDRARGRLRRGDPTMAVELWKGLVSGRWSLIDRFDSDGRHYYVAYRNDPAVHGIKALSLREKQVLTGVAMGDSNKLIAYKLGLSKSAVGTYIASAKKKLGIASRTVLVQMVHQFGLEDPKES